MLSKELIKLSQELGKVDKLYEIVNSLKKYDDFYIYKTSLSKTLDGCTDPVELFGYNAIRYIQLLLYRSRSLIEGSIHSLNSKCALSAVLAVRAHYETTGSVIFLLKRLLSYYKKNIDFERLDKDLKSLALGSTTIEIDGVPMPIQVMNTIDATDEYLKKVVYKSKPPAEKMFRESYDDLCEFCHPNYHGITSGSEIIHSEKSIIYQKTGIVTKAEFTFFFHLMMSIMLFLHGYEEVFKLLQKNETMPLFHKK